MVKKDKRQAVWITRDRREVPIATMDDSHLRNLHRFLLDNANKYRRKLVDELLSEAESAFCYPGNGEMAQMSAESAGADAMNRAGYYRKARREEVLRACIPQWPTILDEMRRRNLMPRIAPRGKDRPISIVGSALQRGAL